MFTLARSGQLFTVPLAAAPGKTVNILDLGCGTGIWAIDVAEFVFSSSSHLLAYTDHLMFLGLANMRLTKSSFEVLISL